MAKDPTKTRVMAYDVYIDSGAGYVDVGLIEEPEATIKTIRTAIENSQIGKVDLGDRIVGAGVTIKLKFQEITLANLARAFPWFSGVVGTDEIPLCPPTMGVDLYTYAVAMALQPKDLDWSGDDEDHSETLYLLKVVPISDVVLKGDGTKDALIPIEFKAYPDRADLPDVNFGSIGEPVVV